MTVRRRGVPEGPHWSDAEFSALLSGTKLGTSPERAFEVLNHFECCPLCRARVIPHISRLTAPRPRGGAGAYDFVIRRAEKRACEQARAFEASRELAATEVEKNACVGTLGDYVERALAEEQALPNLQYSRAEAMFAQARKLRREDPQAALFTAHSAANFAEHLDPAQFPEGAVADLKAEIASEMANLYRIGGDFDEAESSFVSALATWDFGSQDVEFLTRCGGLLASHLIDQRKYEEGESLMRRTVAAWRKLGNRHEEARELVTLGIHLGYFREPSDAVLILRNAVEKIDPAEDPALALSAYQSLIYFYAQLGDAEMAWVLLKQVEPLFEAWGTEIDRFKKWWVEGLVLTEKGKLWHAEEKLTAAERGFDRKKLPYQKALVQLDLVALHLTRKKFTPARQLVQEALATFQALGIAREALASVVLLAEAVRGETATVAQVRAAARVLSRR